MIRRPSQWRPLLAVILTASGAVALGADKSELSFAADLVVELAASEHLVSSPVAIDFSPDGRLWVVEMLDYSRLVDEKFEPSGSIKSLVDSDGDGQFDRATVFQGGLRFPTDVKAWGEGVIVCDAPDVIYFEDTNGDGAADVRKVLLTGFGTENAQARVNSLRWGLDNWLYGSGGLLGGHIKSFSGHEADLGSRDFRFRPETGEIEPVAGYTQQGRARDDWGNWFGCTNGELLKHYPLDDRYISRNPHVAPASMHSYVPEGDAASQFFPISKPTLYKLSGPPGRPTSVCGLEIYRDDLLGPDFAGDAFLAEPVNQLVHRLELSSRGATFEGRRAPDEQDRQFLASSEESFRPVQLRTGLDGCLWLVDMHRAVIEHQKWIPEETLRTLNLMEGRELGRIYRIRPKGRAPRPLASLHQFRGEQLAVALDSPNGPQRDLAQQLLVTRRDVAAAPALEKLFAASPRPETRLHAMCALDGLDALDERLIERGLSDPHPGVRRHAVRLAEPRLENSNDLAAAALPLVNDSDAQVRLQLAYSLGAWNDPRAAAALATLATTNHDDPYLLSAVWSSVDSRNVATVVGGCLAPDGSEPQPESLVKPIVKLAAAVGDETCLRSAFAKLSSAPDHVYEDWQLTALAELLEADNAAHRRLRRAIDGDLQSLIAEARLICDDAAAALDRRLAALRIFAAGAGKEDLFSAATQLLAPQHPPELQRAAIELLLAADAARGAKIVLENWSAFTPDIRTQLLAVLVEREATQPILLENVKGGLVRPDDFGAADRERLLNHPKPELRALAAEAFAGGIDADRDAVVKSFADIDDLSGAAAHGRELYKKHCASCHRLENDGHVVGPDLAALSDPTPAYLLEAIFDPNRRVEQRYLSYVAVTDEGQAHTGILSGETATSITLREQNGKEHNLLRSQLEAFQSSGASLMPTGLERDLSRQDVADLLAYLAAQRMQPSQPLNATPAR